jgi:tripartite-type tricarboxylate transporter receptor subunit TctC
MKIAAGIALLALSFAAGAQQYPTKPIRFVIPYPPGGVDITARLLIPTLEKELGQPWIIDYRPGATGIIGVDNVAKSPADGYSLMMCVAFSWVLQPAVRKVAPFDPIKDFTPISAIIEPLGVIVANNNFPPNNLTEMIEWTRRNPGKGAWATSGIGSSWHINSEVAKKLGKFDVLHTPFQGFGPMFPAVLNGQIPMGMFAYTSIYTMITSGKVKLLGVMTTEGPLKALALPGVQSLSEVAGGAQFVTDWLAVAGPAGLPDPIVRRVNAALRKAVATPEFVERTTREKALIIAGPPEQLAQRVRADFALSQRLVKETGIRIDE